MQIGVLIPAFNEEKTIGKLISKINELNINNILVVDDGSEDSTSFVSKENNATVIRHSKNLGKGTAIKRGLDYFSNQDIEAIILMDADGQHNPTEIINFLEVAKDRSKKMVIGNRMCNHKNMPLLRWITNRTMSFIIWLICMEYVPDTQCGYRLLRKELLKNFELVSCNYEIESEMVLRVAKSDNKIYSIPISTIYKEETSHIQPIKDGLRFLKLIFNFLFKN